jgi:hypothetical protein
MQAVIAIDLDLRPVHWRFGSGSGNSLQNSLNFPPNSGGHTKQECKNRHESLSFASDSACINRRQESGFRGV